LAPLTVGFSSAGSYDPAGATLTYSWTFGDGGTSTAANPSHTYSAVGAYSANLTVSDGLNATTSSNITINVTLTATNQPPVVAASATPTSGAAPLTVAFSSAGSYDPEGTTLTYTWTFGDGASSTAANPSHTYAAAGAYSAQLSVSDGTNSASSSLFPITATAPLPAVVLIAPTNGASWSAPATITCSASVTANGHTITTVQFYNGATLLGQAASAPYAYTWTNVSAGNYSFTAQAVYDSGARVVSAPVSVSVGGLVAAYGFEEGSGTTVTDASGNGLNGTVNGATWSTAGKDGGALIFNGTNSYVDLGNPVPLQLTGSMTLSAWVLAAGNPPNDGQIIAKSDLGTAVTGWYLKSTPDTGVRTFGVAVSPDGSSRVQRYSQTVPSLNTWYYVAGVYNASAGTLDIYVNGVLDDGVLKGTVPTSQFDPNLNVTIGKRSGGYYFWGTIDDLRIYNRALSASEIQADMNSPVDRPAPPTNLRVVVAQ
jgi:PKD repeat protein